MPCPPPSSDLYDLWASIVYDYGWLPSGQLHAYDDGSQRLIGKCMGTREKNLALHAPHSVIKTGGHVQPAGNSGTIGLLLASWRISLFLPRKDRGERDNLFFKLTMSFLVGEVIHPFQIISQPFGFSRSENTKRLIIWIVEDMHAKWWCQDAHIVDACINFE